MIRSGLGRDSEVAGSNRPVNSLLVRRVVRVLHFVRRKVGMNPDPVSLPEARQRLVTSELYITNLERALNEHSIVAVTDRRGRIIYVNDKFCGISGYSRQELIGQDHRVINSGYHSKDFMRDMWKTIHAGATWKGEVRNRAKSGVYYWVDTTIVPFADDEGKIQEFVSIRTDITARKTVELSLQRSEGFLRKLADSVPTQIAYWKTDQTCLFANKSYCDWYGKSPEQLQGMSLRSLLGERGYAEVGGHVARVHDGKSFSFYQYVQGADGAMRHLWTTGFPDMDSGSVAGVFIVRSDVSEIQESKLKLAASEAELRQIIEHEPECVKLLSTDGRLLQMNPAGLRMIGAESAAQVIGTKVSDLILPEDRRAFAEVHERAVRGESGTLEFRLRALNGEIRWMDTHVVGMRDTAGKVHLLLAVTRDISELKRQQELISEMGRRIMTIAERERAEMAGEMHDSVGHSLVLLKLNLQRELSKVLPGKTDLIHEHLRPIDEVLQVVRTMSHRLSPMYLNKLGIATAIEDLCEKTAQQAGVRVVARVDELEDFFPENWNINLYRIVQEAITNAVKYSGATVIQVNARRLHDNLHVLVCDNGSGVRDKQSLTTGLGMTLIRERAASLGGSAEFANKPQGFVVQVIIPK